MKIIPSHMTIATYCERLAEGSIVVNHDYQRSNQVWPSTAQSFLIESILLGYPVPKLTLYQITDRISRKTRQEIVDGQQRTEAIKSFFDDDLRLSRTLEFESAAGSTYSELAGELQDVFLKYDLGIDLFVDATERQVREIFRRINAYEVPLNPEEQRHAKWQGAFKWYIYHLSARHDELFRKLGTFGQKQLVRMTDMKLLTEVSHALLHGITTTNKRDLDRVYEEYDAAFDEQEGLEARIDGALRVIGRLEVAHGTEISKPFQLYSLILALTHAADEIATLASVESGGRGLVPESEMERTLGVLADALEAKAATGQHGAFVKASSAGTNVVGVRKTRFQGYLAAVQQD